MLMIRNIDLYVQIPGLSRPGIQIFKFQFFKDLCEPFRCQKIPIKTHCSTQRNQLMQKGSISQDGPEEILSVEYR